VPGEAGGDAGVDGTADPDAPGVGAALPAAALGEADGGTADEPAGDEDDDAPGEPAGRTLGDGLADDADPATGTT
jgi:hypothetical protein